MSKPASDIVDSIVRYAERLRDRDLIAREIVELDRVRSTLTGIDLHSERRSESWCIADHNGVMEDGYATKADADARYAEMNWHPEARVHVAPRSLFDENGVPRYVR